MFHSGFENISNLCSFLHLPLALKRAERRPPDPSSIPSAPPPGKEAAILRWDTWLRCGFSVSMKRPTCKMQQPAAGALPWPSLPGANIHPGVQPRVTWSLDPGLLRHEFIHSLIHSFHSNLQYPRRPSSLLIILSLSFPSLGTEHHHTPLSL